MTLSRVPPLSLFEESPFRRALVEWLREVPVGEVVTYDDLSELAGEEIRQVWHLVASAREVLLKEGVAFDVVTNVGLKRLDDAGKVAAAEGYLSKGRNAAKRSVRMLRASNVAALSPEERVRYTVADIRAGVALLFGSKRIGQELEKTVAAGTSSRQLRESVKDTLRQFSG